jgi:hypothetical protein
LPRPALTRKPTRTKPVCREIQIQLLADEADIFIRTRFVFAAENQEMRGFYTKNPLGFAGDFDGIFYIRIQRRYLADFRTNGIKGRGIQRGEVVLPHGFALTDDFVHHISISSLGSIISLLGTSHFSAISRSKRALGFT